MTLRRDLRARLRAHGLAPNRHLGQHFMVDRTVLADLAAIADEHAGTTVLEIGPGTGLLTAELLARGHRVLAVEIDRGLRGLLAEDFAGPVARGDLRLVHGDALAGKQALHPAIVDLAAAGAWCLVANLPYAASLPLVLNALALPRQPERIGVTLQYAAADRLCAAPGDPAWGATAAVAAAAGSGRLLRRVPARAFEPPPRVGSAILSWQPVRPLPAGYPAWVRRLFASRRKVLSRALRDTGLPRERADRLVTRLGIATTKRVERCTVEELLALHAALETA